MKFIILINVSKLHSACAGFTFEYQNMDVMTT